MRRYRTDGRVRYRDHSRRSVEGLISRFRRRDSTIALERAAAFAALRKSRADWRVRIPVSGEILPRWQMSTSLTFILLGYA